MKERHHVAVQMEKEKQDQKDNGPIVLTADQLWKYSGETEEIDPSFAQYEKERRRIKRFRNSIHVTNFS